MKKASDWKLYMEDHTDYMNLYLACLENHFHFDGERYHEMSKEEQKKELGRILMIAEMMK